MIEPTDEMADALFECASDDEFASQEDLMHGLAGIVAIAERELRAAIAAEIDAALAADRADDDVTSGEAIWEQGGYRRGLEAAASIVRGEP